MNFSDLAPIFANSPLELPLRLHEVLSTQTNSPSIDKMFPAPRVRISILEFGSQLPPFVVEPENDFSYLQGAKEVLKQRKERLSEFLKKGGPELKAAMEAAEQEAAAKCQGKLLTWLTTITLSLHIFNSK